MPTPMGHTLAGIIVYSLHKKPFLGDRFLPLILAAGMANAPDLDWLPGILSGQPALYHQGISHSLGFALLVSAGIALLFSLRDRPFLPVFSLCLAAYLSHLGLDLFTYDGRAPYGIPLLWPISDATFLSPEPIFRGVHHVKSTTASISDFLTGVLNPNNLFTIALEILYLLPVLLLSNWFGKVFEENRKYQNGSRLKDQ
jgi:inner membrane protein